jgi:poly(glycerol-phosphate) alpha-glucosyltransferase
MRWAEQFGCQGKVLLFLGRIHPKKGLLPLLQGFKQALDGKANSRSEWALVIAGWDDGGHEPALREYVRNNGLDGSVFFAGPLYDSAKVEAYESSDWFVLPSQSEGLPMTVLEAWAHGLPVAMSSECNLQAAIAQEVAVEMAPSPDGVEAALRQVFGMPEAQRQAMGELGRSFAEEHFSIERVARELTAVYDWVIGKAEMPACVRL